jgi:hypothetical protein
VGNEITIKVGVVGDRDKLPTDRIGKKGFFVNFLVTFGPSGGLKHTNKSDRNSPKTELKNEALKEFKTIKDGIEYSGTVEIDEDKDNVGEIKICLGHAGGDTCTVKIGGTSTCEDASITFTNWRKIFYKLYLPSCMKEELQDLGGNKYDFSTNLKDSFKKAGELYKLELERAESILLDQEQDYPNGNIFDENFLVDHNRTKLVTRISQKVFILNHCTTTSNTNTFCSIQNERLFHVFLCDKIYSFDDKVENIKTKEFETKAKETHIQPIDGYFMPRSSKDNSFSVTSLDWEAVTPAPPNITFATTYIDAQNVDIIQFYVFYGATSRLHKIIYNIQKGITRLTDSLPADFPGNETNNLRTFLRDNYSQSVTLNNAINIKITAEKFDKNDALRVTNAQNTIVQLLTAIHKENGGFDSYGTKQKGKLAATTINIGKSTSKEIVIDLPDTDKTKPGKFVGPLTGTTCPIKITYKYQSHYEPLGQNGKNLINLTYNKSNERHIAIAIFHELGHALGLAVVPEKCNAYAPGVTPTNWVKDNDTVYNHNGNKGHIYVDRGHKGPHCAYGLSDDDKDILKVPDFKTLDDDKKGPCLMFGQVNNNMRIGFCPQCTIYIKAVEGKIKF